ncbi:MAG TPA: sulfatase-like hydrolase/transferase [Gemmatimonadales bacterium]|nr:sulfatase-like hydrolase/transferase [Gemmatimonadales bacterium]
MRTVRNVLFVLGLAACGEMPSPSSVTGHSSPSTPSNPQPAPGSAAGRPNIVYILTDDQDAASTWMMPNLNNLIAAQGITFESFYYSLSLCCPSRTSMLRGQYPHNHGVHSNFYPTGGWKRANELGLETSTVATWLHDAGYRTSYMGKYMNEYELSPAGYVPPGWDDWHALWTAISASNGYYNYRLNENGKNVYYGTGAANYLTDVLSRRAVEFINAQATATQPFFLWVSPLAPHGPATPADRHLNAFSTIALPQPPNFNEADVSDKPRWVRNNPLINSTVFATQTALHRHRLETLLAVDEMIKSIVDALTATGQLDNTYIFFASDNGFHIGQHRLVRDRNSAYEEDIRGPFYVRGPGVPAGVARNHLVLNNDLAPTFAEIGGAATPGFVDGRSLLPVLAAAPPPASTWRQRFVVEYQSDPTSITDVIPPQFFALRTDRYTYIEYVTGERELYDNQADPYQLANGILTAPPELIPTLSAQLALVHACVGSGCRFAEDGAGTGPPPNQPPIATISSPSPGITVPLGTPVGFAGSGSDPEDGALVGGSLSWTSSLDGPIGTGTGFTTSGLSVGTHTITLTAGDSQNATATATIAITITQVTASNQSPTARIVSPSDGTTVPLGTAVSFAGSGSDSEDGVLSGASLTWTSSLDGPIGIGTGFSTSSLSAGTHTITLTVGDSQNATATATVGITIAPPIAPNQPPSAVISSPGAVTSVPQGTVVTFAGSGNDPEDGVLSGGALVWTSSRDGQIGIGTGFTTSSLSVGTHTITLTAGDAQNATGTATVSITVSALGNQPPVANFVWACNASHQCTFDAGSSSDDVGIVLWSWTWGNGRGDSKLNQYNKNTWKVAGTYTVTLTVKDGGGLTGFIAQSVVVP